MYGTSNEQGTSWTAYGDASSLPDWTTPKSSEYDVSIPTCPGAAGSSSSGSSSSGSSSSDGCLDSVGNAVGCVGDAASAVGNAAADTASAAADYIPGGRRLLSKKSKKRRKLVGRCNPTCPKEEKKEEETTEDNSGNVISGSKSWLTCNNGDYKCYESGNRGCTTNAADPCFCCCNTGRSYTSSYSGGSCSRRRLAAVGVKESTTCKRTKTLQVRSLVKNEDKTTTIYFHDTLAELIVSEDKAHFQSPLCKFLLPYTLYLENINYTDSYSKIIYFFESLSFFSFFFSLLQVDKDHIYF